MKIVVLDGYTLNPGDLSWDGLRALGECVLYDRTLPEQILERAAGAEVILTNKVVLSRETIAALPSLRYVGVLATGYNVVDTDAARERNIPVTNVPGYSTDSVAQAVFALLLELTHRTGHHAEAVRSGRWSECADFSFWDFPLIELSGMKMGIVGFGSIGKAVAKLADAFGMHVIVHTRTRPADFPRHHVLADLESVFAWSDVLSFHCPLTDQTRGLVNADRLALMKSSAYLLNTARGPLVDDNALAGALNDARLAGAGLDALTVEPPHLDNPLLTAKNCIITPHIGWATTAARTRLMDVAVSNVRAFQERQPKNVVNH